MEAAGSSLWRLDTLASFLLAKKCDGVLAALLLTPWLPPCNVELPALHTEDVAAVVCACTWLPPAAVGENRTCPVAPLVAAALRWSPDNDGRLGVLVLLGLVRAELVEPGLLPFLALLGRNVLLLTLAGPVDTLDVKKMLVALLVLRGAKGACWHSMSSRRPCQHEADALHSQFHACDPATRENPGQQRALPDPTRDVAARPQHV